MEQNNQNLQGIQKVIHSSLIYFRHDIQIHGPQVFVSV